MDLKRLGPGNAIFLIVNLAAVIVGTILCVVSGPTGPLILLVVGAVGLALKKLVILFGWEDNNSSETDAA